MKLIFVDTSFYQALLNPRDNWHEKALELSNAFRGQVPDWEQLLRELSALMSQARLNVLWEN